MTDLNHHRDALAEQIDATLRQARVEDGSPIALLNESDRYHVKALLLRALLAPGGVVAGIVAAERATVGAAFLTWAQKNEIAEPPLDWGWFGEIVRWAAPNLHEGGDE